MTNIIRCRYTNSTDRFQVITLVEQPGFERVVLPGNSIEFEASSEDRLEIRDGMLASAIVSDRIPCLELQICDLLYFYPETPVAS